MRVIIPPSWKGKTDSFGLEPTDTAFGGAHHTWELDTYQRRSSLRVSVDSSVSTMLVLLIVLLGILFCKQYLSCYSMPH
jgi:hypothetical protein